MNVFVTASADSPALKPEPAPGTGAPRRSILRRWWFWAIVVVALIVAAGASAAYVGTRALEAKTELESAQALVPQLQSEAMALDLGAADATLERVMGHTSRAADLTDGVLWRVGEGFPVLGKNLTAVRELAAVTDQVMTEVAAPLVGVAGSIDPASFTPVEQVVDLEPLIAAVPAIEEATVAVGRAVEAVDSIDTEGTIGPIADARDKLAALLAELAPTLETLNTIVPMLPPALGSEAPRTYVLMFQNPAESRALGGTALSFAVITVDNGAIDLLPAVPTSRAGFPTYPESIVPLPDGVNEIYPGYLGTFIANATTRPSFGTAAAITRENWRRSFGMEIDGVLSADPVALGYVMRATDPIPLSNGDVLTGDSTVTVLLNSVYRWFNSGDTTLDNISQDAVYAEAVEATFDQLTGGQVDPAILVAALLQGWEERRLLFWSTNPQEQAQLEANGLTGELPVSDDETDRVGLYFHDNVGSKLNYYLQQSVALGTASCRDDGRQSNRVTVELTNTVDPADAATLSPSIVGTWKSEGVPRAAQRLWVVLYAPPGASITGATVDGEPAAIADLHDTDYPVAKLVVLVRPGETVTLTYDFASAEPGTKALEAQVTPLVNPTEIVTKPLDCATVAGE
ncbi:DUF4012 domain-containing protein [Marisediminicola antarctica]